MNSKLWQTNINIYLIKIDKTLCPDDLYQNNTLNIHLKLFDITMKEVKNLKIALF